MKIYTKTGDSGETSLYSGERVSKTHPRMVVCGMLDELNSHLGAALAAHPEEEVFRALVKLQSLLFELGSDIASTKISPGTARITEKQILSLEAEIDAWTALLPPLRAFILPGGSPAAAQIHLARTVCRRAERELIEAREKEALPDSSLVFLNRLSDYLFTLARYENLLSGHPETEWKPSDSCAN